ncbi:MAG: SUMF1/EgtB/PvdO family nonheme iron enzyme [bacterium]
MERSLIAGICLALALAVVPPAAAAAEGAGPRAGENSGRLPRRITGRDGAPMVLVPAGRFIMGSEEGGSDERPRRRIHLDAFYIDKYPVTNGRFRKFGKPAYDFGIAFAGDQKPIVGVTWLQARDYCRWAGRRLPTEAEWEKAERGTDGRKFPWGEMWDPSKVVWLHNSGISPHPVDRSYLTHESPYGAVDMEGNVWGWVADWYSPDYYGRAPDRNPKGPPSGKKRVIRGCSWQSDDPWGFRAAYREKRESSTWSHIIGFRCAVSASQSR